MEKLKKAKSHAPKKESADYFRKSLRGNAAIIG